MQKPRWYVLISGKFLELGMKRSTIDHGIFVWSWQNETCYLAIETDDILFASTTRAPFLYLKHQLEQMFDLTCNEGHTLHFLNLRIIQSPHDISFDQTQHIQQHILQDYFPTSAHQSIPYKAYPFPLEPTFEQTLFEELPLTDLQLHQKENSFGFSFNQLVGSPMHITTISRPDLSYAVMRLSGYMSTPNNPIFDALHQTLCYLFHHPHLPIMYPSKPLKNGGDCLSSYWQKGHAEYLLPNMEMN
jgi:hypothetical protein